MKVRRRLIQVNTRLFSQLQPQNTNEFRYFLDSTIDECESKRPNPNIRFDDSKYDYILAIPNFEDIQLRKPLNNALYFYF